jgi:uncharacterized zinc-type alcohol dehydrogenase-like protein
MLRNEWGFSSYPLVPGHEVVGRVEAVGSMVKNLVAGDRVGLGWFSESCMTCPQCMGGDHNLCATGEGTIVGRHGGFADLVRSHWAWATKLPEALSSVSAGPLFCGGITVFSPIVEFGVRPTDRVGVIGIGGLGHLAVQFLNKWGCEVTAFTSSTDKTEELKKLGAHRVVNSRDAEAMKSEANRFDFIISTVAVPMGVKLAAHGLSKSIFSVFCDGVKKRFCPRGATRTPRLSRSEPPRPRRLES